MLEQGRAHWQAWPGSVRFSVALVAGAMALSLSYVLLAGPPKAVLPSDDLFAPVEIEQSLAASRPELSSFDFIFRPAFAINRKPPVQIVVPADAAEQAAKSAASEVESIDGVSLLGIFGSGEVSGVIVRLDDGARRRITVGESVKGWKLSAIESRRARLRSPSGEEAVLKMAFATDQVPLADEPVEALSTETLAASSSPREDGSTAQAVESAPDAEAPPARMTFGSMYQRRREAAAEGQKGKE